MKAKFYTRLVTTGLFVVLVADLSFSNRQVVTDTLQKFAHREYTFNEAKDAIAADYPEKMKQKYDFINLNGLFASSVGQRICNDTYKLNNGMLYGKMNEYDVTPEIDRTVELNNLLEDTGIDFVYIVNPNKMDVNNELLPSGLYDYTNSNADRFITGVTAEGVDVLDLRQMMSDTLEHIDEYFYRTDHHWNAVGAFKGFQEISEYLQEMYPEEKIYGENQDPDKWEVHKLEDWFLGSRGKRTGIYYGGTDDLIWLTPKFDTEISFANVYKSQFYSGDFCDANIRESHIESRDYFNDNPYCVYIGGNYPLVKYRNLNAPSDKKVLLIQDSFCLPVEAFMSTVFSELDAIDMRYYTCGSLEEYILDTRPDVVVMNINAGTVPNISVYGTGGDTEVGSESTRRLYDSGSEVIRMEPEAGNTYHYSTVYSGIEAGKRYKVTLDSVNVTAGDAKGILLRLYDPVGEINYDSDIMDLNYCEAKGSYEWVFTAPKEVENLNLLIYAGIPGDTEDVGLEISGLKLYQYL